MFVCVCAVDQVLVTKVAKWHWRNDDSSSFVFSKRIHSPKWSHPWNHGPLYRWCYWSKLTYTSMVTGQLDSMVNSTRWSARNSRQMMAHTGNGCKLAETIIFWDVSSSVFHLPHSWHYYYYHHCLITVCTGCPVAATTTRRLLQDDYWFNKVILFWLRNHQPSHTHTHTRNDCSSKMKWCD